MNALNALLIFAVLLALGCGRKEEAPSKYRRVTVSLGAAASSSQKEFSLPDPATSAGIKCLGLFISYPEMPSENVCTSDGSTTNVISRPHTWAGLAPRGGTLSADVLIGSARRFQVIGFDTNLPGCPALSTNMDVYKANLSKPFLMGETTVPIDYTTKAVTINASYISGSTTKIGDCQGPLFGWRGSAASCGLKAAFADIDFSYIKCMESNMLYGPEYPQSSDLYVFKTSSGLYAKMVVTSASTMFGATYTLYDSAGATILSSTTASVFGNYYFDIDSNTQSSSSTADSDFYYSASAPHQMMIQSVAKGANVYRLAATCAATNADWENAGGGCRLISQNLVFSAMNQYDLSWRDAIWDASVAGARGPEGSDNGRTYDFDPTNLSVSPAATYPSDTTVPGYCHDLLESGFNDWRMPTRAELDAAGALSAQSMLRSVAGYYLWSGTKGTTDPGKAWSVRYGTTTAEYAPTDVSMMRVMCVRKP